MSLMILLVGAMGCGGGNVGPAPADPGPCALSTTQFATGVATRTFHLACGELLLNQFEVESSGPLRIELFTDGQRVIPSLTADAGDVTFSAMTLTGTWTLQGSGPVTAWVLDESGGGGGAVAGGGSSHWAGGVGRPGGPALLIGAHSAWQSAFHVALDPDGVAVVTWGGTGEEIAVRDGQTLFLDPLFLAVGPDNDAVWSAWADAVSIPIASDADPDPPPVSWELPDDDHAAVLAALPELVQALIVPDLSASAAADIAGQGVIPGAVLAPFLVARDAPIFGENPDWWVRGFDGEELDWDGAAIVDASHPEAAAWLAQRVGDVVAAGAEVVVLAQLSAGAVPGLRREQQPGVVAYRQGLQALVGAAGDATVIARDAPVLPSVGLVGAAGGSPALAFANGRWWWNDAGPLALDEAPEDVARGALTAMLVTGGAYSIGGTAADVGSAAAERALDAALIALRRGTAVPTAGASQPAVSTWALDDGHTALLNQSDSPATLDAPDGNELFSGGVGGGARTLAPGAGEVWH